MPLRKSLILSPVFYKAALQNAEAKNSVINYEKLQKDRSWTLVFNPITRDAYFLERVNIWTAAAGYYEAWPQTRNYPQAQIGKIIDDINDPDIGWPHIQGV